MSHDEESVVDREVEQAWRKFRIDLAEAIADPEIGEVVLTPAGVEVEKAPHLEISCGEDEPLLVLIYSPWRPERRFRFSAADRQRLRDMGAGICLGVPAFEVAGHLPDEAAHRAYVLLREMWDVVHPAFVTVEPDDLAINDDPAADEPSGPVPPAEVPEIVHPTSQDQVAAWVDAVLTPGFGHPPRKDRDGDIRVIGPDDTRAYVTVRSRHRVEVWTFLAEEVRFGAAHRAIDRLSRRYPYHRFFLVQDDLVASTVVSASPLVPDHLTDALDRTLAIAAEEAGLDLELKRRRRRREPEPTPDATLLSLVSSAGRLGPVDLSGLVRRAAGDSEEVLATWLSAARRARAESLALVNEATDDTMRETHRLAFRRWTRTVAALKTARDQTRPESRSA